jgi:hypothetical protein
MTLRNRTLVDTLIGRALGTDTNAEVAPDPAPTAESTEQTKEPE